MTPTSYQQTSLVSTVVNALHLPANGLPSEDGGVQARCARADRADACWSVRVVLTADPGTGVQSVRVIIDDREARRILLHTLWTDWHAVPMLATHLVSPLSPAGSLETAAADLAAALLVSLQRNADGCLEGLGTPRGSLPTRPPGPQERAAIRNVRDATMYWRTPATRPREEHAGEGSRA
jgi:hypothetical protein